jgi:hypothetical protein
MDQAILLFSSHSQIQNKTATLETVAASTGLKINREKTKVIQINVNSNNNIEPIALGYGEPENVT